MQDSIRREDNYKIERNQARKVVSTAMRRKAEKEINDLLDKPNNMFKLVKFLKKERQNVNGGRNFRGING